MKRKSQPASKKPLVGKPDGDTITIERIATELGISGFIARRKLREAGEKRLGSRWEGNEAWAKRVKKLIGNGAVPEPAKRAKAKAATPPPQKPRPTPKPEPPPPPAAEVPDAA